MKWNKEERLSWMERLTKRTPDQRLIVELSAKSELSTSENKLLTNLWSADKLKFKAREAERKTSALFHEIEQGERRRQNHAKIIIGVAALQLAAENGNMTSALLSKTRRIDNVDMDGVMEVLKIYNAVFLDDHKNQ